MWACMHGCGVCMLHTPSSNAICCIHVRPQLYGLLLLYLSHRIAVTRHPPVYGITYAFSQGILFFLFAVIFRFGAFLANLPVDHLVYEPFADVFRVFFAIIFGAFAIGEAFAFAPNYSKAKISANRIFFLLNRVPVIDNYSEDGEKLVSLSMLKCLNLTHN